MIFNGWLVRFWRGPPGRMDLIWTWPGVFYHPGASDVARPRTGCCGWVKGEESLQAGSGGGAEEGGRAGPAPAFVYCSARGRRRGTAGDVTPRAPLATNLHRTTRLLGIKYGGTDLPLLPLLWHFVFPRTRPVNFSTVGSRTCPPGKRSFVETSPFSTDLNSLHAPFRSLQSFKFLHSLSITLILGHMYGAVNVCKKNN
jgi:hypothetical protein